MPQTDIKREYIQICYYIFESKIKSAIDLMATLFRYTTQSDYFYQLDSISNNYKNLVKYNYEGYHDPKRIDILNNISAALLTLADEIYRATIEKDHYQRKFEKSILVRELGSDAETMTARIDELFFGKELEQAVKEAGGEIAGERLHEQLFRFIWLTGKIEAPHAKLLRKINGSTTIEWHVKCIVVSAITQSLLDHFDQEKMLILIEFIESGEPQVFQRALIGLVISLLVYDQRIRFYPELVKKLKDLSEDESIRNETEAVLLQFLMARETEKITREFEEEVLPEMKKVMPKLEDKLQLGDLFEDDDMDGKNPGWKDLIDEVPGLFERIEKFTRMQMEGADVFMSTFSLLKRFDFFNRMSNWLMPFYQGNPELRGILGEDEEFSPRLLEGLEKAFYICNSDKYSFALNFQAVPQQQRSMIITYFESELEQMKEMINEEQILDQSMTSSTIMTQYIQDLYRFYKLIPSKEEFLDIFKVDFNFNQLYFYRNFFERKGFTERIAAFYFDKGHYFEAIRMYEYISKKETPASEYFEKMGYSYQQLSFYREAIEYYKMADLFDANRLWLLKKLGWCSYKMKDFPSALTYFEDAIHLQPDNFKIRIQIAQCYLSMLNFEEALKQFSIVSFSQPGNLKVTRPIAYCQFILGKLDQAAESYEQVIRLSGSPTSYDLMNFGHVLLCLGKRKEALENYSKSKLKKEFTKEEFIIVFNEDIPNLIKNGIPEEDIPLLRDYLLFQED